MLQVPVDNRPLGEEGDRSPVQGAGKREGDRLSAVVAMTRKSGAEGRAAAGEGSGPAVQSVHARGGPHANASRCAIDRSRCGGRRG